jgi:hypothetical protein
MINVAESKIMDITKRYLKEYLDKDWMMPLKRFMHMDEVSEAVECAYSSPWRFKCWVEENKDVMETIEQMVENEEIRPDIFDLDDVEFVEYADDLFKGRLKDFAQSFIEYTSASGDRDIPLFVVASYKRDIHNEWLVHMTNNLSGISNEGFNIGVTIDELAYTPGLGTTNGKYGPGYNFAFTADEAYVAEHSGYGKYCVLFQGSGIMIWHYGDEQNQVIFYGPTAKNLIFITKSDEYSNWCVKSQITGRVLFDSALLEDVVDWCIRNFAQYHNHLTGKNQNAWFNRRRNMDPDKKWWSDKKVSEGIFSKYCKLI